MKNSIIVGIVAVCVVVGVGLAFVFIKIPSIAETTTGYGTTSEQQTTTTGAWTTTTETQPPKPPTETQTPTPPSVEMAKLSITVHAPSNSPSGEAVYMLVGELYFESTREFSMTKISANTWRLVLEAPVGSVLRYRYSREMSWDKEESYVYRDGIGFHYREIVVKEDMELEESIAKWEDLPLLPNSVGDLIGKVTDSAGLPVMGLMVSAGPQQTFTDFNGNYRIYGVPAGPCPVSVRALNGEYYSQIARIDIRAGETTTHNFTVTSAPMRKVIFEVAVPHDHPDGAVPRILGDTYHLGFYTTFGGTAIHVSRVIDMEPDPEEERYWTYTTTIGEGTYVRYYYTLGDHRINRERDKNGNYVLRGLFVKGETTVDDDVWSWKAGNQVPLTLEVKSPTDDTVYFTTDEWGGYEPIRMWQGRKCLVLRLLC
ncbi:MAG: carboxypeptidase-like regulatory domain-containing protein [Candidatus Hadarchaeaceae archaeon]